VNPHGAVDRADADRTVALRDNLARRTFETIFNMRAIKKALSSKQRIEDARGAVGGAYFCGNLLRRIPAPVNRAIALAHRRPPATDYICVTVVKRFGLELSQPEFFYRLQDSTHGGFSDLPAVHIAFGN
jgi:hypothetical protein